MIPMPKGWNKPVANVRDDMDKEIARLKEMNATQKLNQAPEVPKQNKAAEMQRRINALNNLRRGLK